MTTSYAAPLKDMHFVLHPKWDERPLLICVRRAGQDVSSTELLAQRQPRVAEWSLPDVIEFVGAIPHGATGKVLKTALRKQFGGYQLQEQA